MNIMNVSLGPASVAGWKDVVTLKANRAVIFVDCKVAEILHWVGGIATLFDAGAEDVRDFSSFESGQENQKKAVFIVSGPLEGVTEQTIHDIVTQSHFQYVVVLTSAHPLLQSNDSALDFENSSFFADFEESLQEWMGNMNYTAEVQHVNLFSCEICPGFFITPAFSELFPLLSSDLSQICYQLGSRQSREASAPTSLSDLEMSHLPDGLQTQIRHLASSLDGLLQSMRVKEDIYSVGCLSRIVATQLDTFPPAKTRRKANQSRLSLIIVDRTLDLASAVTRQSDVLLDKIVNTLPSLGSSCDRRVVMDSLCHCYSKSSDPSVILPGCLAPTALRDTPHHLTAAIMKKQKEALIDINRKLVETASAEKLPLDLSGKASRIKAEQLDSTMALFKGKYSLIQKHLDMLQVAMATSQTLKHPSNEHCDNMVAREKSLLQSVADLELESDGEESTCPSVFSILSKTLLSEMEKSSEDRELTLDDFLHLLVYVYSLVDGHNESPDEVQLLQDQLAQAIIQEKNCLPPVIQALVGEKVTEAIVPDQVESLWEKLEALLDARDNLKDLNNRVDPGGALSPASVKPLLRQMVEKIVDPAKPDLPDVECKSGGLKDLLKSGFGLFKSSAKPRPGDAPQLMIYVIGGITGSEVKQIKDVVNSAKPGFEVLVGATRISSLESSIQSLIINDNINLV